MDERSLKIRSEWKLHDTVEIYSNSKNKWYSGEIFKIFADDEGEWLEVRYDDAMTKQVQRYCTDIRPKRIKKKKNGFRKFIPPQILINNKCKHNDDDDYGNDDSNDSNDNNDNNDGENVSIMESDEIEIREAWTKGHSVEIYSNTHGEWNRAEIVDIIKDDEGEWLNCFWVRSNGQSMTKQLQRYSSDIRPCIEQSHTYISASHDSHESHESHQRKAPAFHNHSSYCRQSTFNHPASSPARRSKKLRDIAEIDEHGMSDDMHSLNLNDHNGNKTRGKKRKGSLTWMDFEKKKNEIENMNSSEIMDFIASLGSEYERYCKSFSSISGSDIVKLKENELENDFGIATKVHRHKILLEIGKNCSNDESNVNLLNAAYDIDVLNWDSKKVKEWCEQNEILKIYSQNFENNGIDGMLLLDLNSNDLKLIGIKKKHNANVMKIIQNLSKQSFPETNF